MTLLSHLLILLALSLASGSPVVVSPEGPYTTLEAGIAAAPEGGTVEVHGGEYSGPLVVEKTVTLTGVGWPVVDGHGQGTVVQLAAPGIVFQGFVIRNSGDSLDQENSGLVGAAPGLVVANNRFEETLFGVYFKEAPGSVLRGNLIRSKDLDIARRGDPIRVWYSNDVVVENNVVERGRDVVLWYSEHLTIRGNTVREGRYGLHFMYCDDAVIEDNLLFANSVGTFMMYSRRLHLIRNTIAFNHGPSGYGIGLKDMDDALVKDNLFLQNRVGIHLDNSPREVDSTGLIEGNVFAFNDIGVNLMPSVRRNAFTGNSFIDNGEHVTISGGGQLLENIWAVAGRGNYWSDYAGFDQNNDGLGDVAYVSERLFENLIDRHPELRLFIYSPAANAVDFAAKTVPLVRPQPKLVDDAPLMAPVIPAGLPVVPRTPDPRLPATALAMLGVAVALFGLPFFSKYLRPTAKLAAPAGVPRAAGGAALITVRNLQKTFGSQKALDNLSFEIRAGEAVALWGPNGAGKTTALRCLLGLLPCEGTLVLAGHDIRHEGKQARRLVGFVPQELTFHDDLTVVETLEFYARLKRARLPKEPDPTHPLTGVGLAGHGEKRVGELSGGMKQRLALAVALLADPPVLILDEPTSNLDARAREDFLTMLLALKAAGKTLVFSSHRLEEITVLANRVLLLENGRLVADCPPHDLGSHTGWNVTLHLHVGAEHFTLAISTLNAHGFHASPNGKGVRVKVIPGKKGEPIGVLAQAGIAVEDFEIEHLENEEERRTR